MIQRLHNPPDYGKITGTISDWLSGYNREAMVMARPSKTEQEMGYIRDLWNELRVIEAEYHGVITIYSGASLRPGVLHHRMVFTPIMGGMENGLGTVALEFLYPNVEQSTYAGFMWRKAIALARMITEQAEGAKSAPKKRG
jgi:hypothetical protein